jgi:ubiquinone/menaquinone biosynthesis C-methylase UbiE
MHVVYKLIIYEVGMTLKNKNEFKFDKRASVYDEGFEGKLSKKFYNLLMNQIKMIQGAVVLDVGCGTGIILKKLYDLYNIDGYGIDVEMNMITEAQRKCPNMKIITSSCHATPFENSKFDVITSCMAYHHFDDQKGFAKEASRIIKPNGYLYIVDPRFPLIIRKPLNLALKIHKIAGYFGTPHEINKIFSEYGFELDGYCFDVYAQCVRLKKTS